jgi:hypothetical protein
MKLKEKFMILWIATLKYVPFLVYSTDTWPARHQGLDILFSTQKFIYKVFWHVFVVRKILSENKKVYTYM